MNYEVVIGLEVHSELKTQSKIYCSCTTQFGGAENTHCCPVCTGMPGVLPRLNEEVVEYCMRAGLALDCEINRFCRQDRKHYFYPDLPKAFQTSQFDLPICIGGHLDVDMGDYTRRVGITRIHIEEDAGKLIHGKNGTRVDYNRCGVPLIEIVTEPDLRSAEEAAAFMETLRSILLYADVSDCRMEEGSLRCDVNISVRPEGQKEFGTRTEIKNLNSFRSVTRAIEEESARQIEVIENGGKIFQATMHWDDENCEVSVLRSKEDSDDYMYFPEPDILPIVISDEWVDRVKAELPELPTVKKRRYLQEFGLNEKEVAIILAAKPLSLLFDQMVSLGVAPQIAANWVKGDVSRVLNDRGMEPEDMPIDGQRLTGLISLLEKKTISHTIAAKVLELMFDEEGTAEEIVNRHNMAQISDTSAIEEACKEAIANNPKAVEDYRAGKGKALGAMVGYVMKVTKGKANPGLVNEILAKLLDA